MKSTAMTILSVAITALIGAGIAEAADYTLAPSDLADGPTFNNGRGGVPFGYDPDMPPPIGSLTTGPTGYEFGCFWSDVQGSAAGDPNDRDYTALRMSPRDIFGVSDVTISDLSAISYWTQNLNTNYIDWQLKIYTESDVKWYGYRFNFTRPQAADNNWHNYVTDTDLTVSDIYDKVAGGYVAVPGSGLLSDLDALYGSEKILFVDIIAGYATNSPPVDSLLDGVVVTLDSGPSKSMDLVPEPATLGLLAVGGLGVLGRRRRK